MEERIEVIPLRSYALVAEYLKKEEEPLKEGEEWEYFLEAIYGKVSGMTYSEKKQLVRIVEELQFKQRCQSWLERKLNTWQS
jgi:hypothetical protein